MPSRADVSSSSLSSSSFRTFAAGLTLAVSLVAARAARAADGTDVVVEIPDAVRAAVKAEAGGDKVLEFRRDSDEGSVGYIVTASGKDGEYQMRFNESGALTRKWVESRAAAENEEKAVPYEQLPQPVRESLVDQLHGGDVKQVTLRESKPVYEVRTLINGKYYQIRLDAAGKLIDKALSDDQQAEGEREGK